MEIECKVFSKFIEINNMVYKHECKCIECKSIFDNKMELITIEKYLHIRMKQEECKCNSCCWCKYKHVLHNYTMHMKKQKQDKQDDIAGEA